MTLAGRTPDEVYFRLRSMNRQPRFEPRAKWPRRAQCAKPITLIKGQPGVKLKPDIQFSGDRRYLPLVTFERAAEGRGLRFSGVTRSWSAQAIAITSRSFRYAIDLNPTGDKATLRLSPITDASLRHSPLMAGEQSRWTISIAMHVLHEAAPPERFQVLSKLAPRCS